MANNINFVGYEHIHGTKNGKEYDFIKVYCTQPVDSKRGVGTKTLEFVMNNGSANIAEFRNIKLPLAVKPIFEQELGYNGVRHIFSGFEYIKV